MTRWLFFAICFLVPTLANAGEPKKVVAKEDAKLVPYRLTDTHHTLVRVKINGKGPFRLVLDTGASHSALTAQVAEQLGLKTDPRHMAMLHGTTGNTPVPMVPVETLEVGELLMEPRHLPIIPDALGGAEGVLGTDGLANKRIHIDFRREIGRAHV